MGNQTVVNKKRIKKLVETQVLSLPKDASLHYTQTKIFEVQKGSTLMFMPHSFLHQIIIHREGGDESSDQSQYHSNPENAIR